MRKMKITRRSGLEYEKDENNQKVWIFLDKCESCALRLISWLCIVSISVEPNNKHMLKQQQKTLWFRCKTYPQLKMCLVLWCKKCVKSGEPSSWQIAARLWVHLDLKNVPCWVRSFMFVEQEVCRVWGTMVLTNSWVKDFARNTEQSTYQSTGYGNSKASNNVCIFFIGF